MKVFLWLLEIFLPLFGFLATVILAAALKDVKRWAALFIVPALTYYFLPLFFQKQIMAHENIFALISWGLFYTAMLIYYPILLIVAVVVYLRHRHGGGWWKFSS